jgi:hypothetical protein
MLEKHYQEPCAATGASEATGGVARLIILYVSLESDGSWSKDRKKALRNCHKPK